MKKITKLKICNRSLLLLTLAVLASGIQLEATHSSGYASVLIHIIIALLFAAGVGYHIFLHFGRSNWFERMQRQKSVVTRILWWVSIATAVSGLAATVHWLTATGHSPIGGVHGKIGFAMILLAVCHLIKRKSFFFKPKR